MPVQPIQEAQTAPQNPPRLRHTQSGFEIVLGELLDPKCPFGQVSMRDRETVKTVKWWTAPPRNRYGAHMPETPEPRVLASNGAVFVNNTRRHRDVKVTYDEGESKLTIERVMMPGVVVETFVIVEEATDANSSLHANNHVDAFDGFAPNSTAIVRIGVASGCGCSGLFPYVNSPSYSGLLNALGQEIQ